MCKVIKLHSCNDFIGSRFKDFFALMLVLTLSLNEAKMNKCAFFPTSQLNL
jgi:hypothetical protein